jgi:(3S)-linalool synthase
LQWAELFDGFMAESKWLAAGRVPAADEYLRNGVVTSGMPLTLVHVLFLLGHDHAAYNEAAKLITDDAAIPPAISCPAKILRLWDDMGSAEVSAGSCHC